MKYPAFDNLIPTVITMNDIILDIKESAEDEAQALFHKNIKSEFIDGARVTLYRL